MLISGYLLPNTLKNVYFIINRSISENASSHGDNAFIVVVFAGHAGRHVLRKVFYLLLKKNVNLSISVNWSIGVL